MSTEINRVKHCPALLRCFWKLHRSNSINSYRYAGQGQLPSQEVQIYTWPDATLKELCELLQEVTPKASNTNATLILSLVFIDKNGNFGMKQVKDNSDVVIVIIMYIDTSIYFYGTIIRVCTHQIFIDHILYCILFN